jgi:hypothetical protein
MPGISKLLFLLFLSCLHLGVFAQQQLENKLSGRTVSASDKEIVQLASVINLSSSKRAISNRQGYFKMSFLPGDTLFITAIGYESVTIICNQQHLQQLNDTLEVLMKPVNFRLREVVVVSSNPKRDSIARAAAAFLKNDPLMNNYDRVLNRERGSLMSPLTAMYQQFSKEGKDAVKFEEFMAYMEKQKQADRRYNREFVKRVTNLDDKYLDEFMLFCKLNRDFIIAAPEYDLVLATQKCAKEFKASR